MRQRLGLGIRKLRGKATLQLKFSLSYILVIAAVLILLNSYPLLVSQNMMVASNQNNLKSTAKVIESAMIGLEKLTVENVQAALEGLDESGAARIMVTNSAGLVLYDTRQGSNAVGEYALYSVVAVALRGQDASYCSYDGTAFLSRVATPVVYHNQIVGAVYAYDYDTEQSELLEAFRHNLLIISLLIALLVAGLSIVLSQMLTRQISGLLQAIRKVREGAYSHRADASGTDEIAQIAAEFNSLTDRLQTTENARRRFVSDASHELKTPLAGIRLLTDSILQTDHMDEETTKEFVTDIGREAERLSRITENLLRLTRLDSGVVQQPLSRGGGAGAGARGAYADHGGPGEGRDRIRRGGRGCRGAGHRRRCTSDPVQPDGERHQVFRRRGRIRPGGGPCGWGQGGADGQRQRHRYTERGPAAYF